MAGNAECLQIPYFSGSVSSEWFNVVHLEHLEIDPADCAFAALENPDAEALCLCG